MAVLDGVTAQDVLDWGKSLPPERFVGQCGDSFRCLIANYAREVLGRRVHVSPSTLFSLSYYFEVGDTGNVKYEKPFRLSPDLSRLGVAFDRLGEKTGVHSVVAGDLRHIYLTEANT